MSLCQSNGFLSITNDGSVTANTISGVVVTVQDNGGDMVAGTLNTEAVIYPMDAVKVTNNPQFPGDTETIQFSGLRPGTVYYLNVFSATVTNTAGSSLQPTPPTDPLIRLYITSMNTFLLSRT